MSFTCNSLPWIFPNASLLPQNLLERTPIFDPHQFFINAPNLLMFQPYLQSAVDLAKGVRPISNSFMIDSILSTPS
uniref:Ovule protein n=1 Tax=Parascaris equorum TaxID=6256 RepID=A0A914S9X6_PAREQ